MRGTITVRTLALAALLVALLASRSAAQQASLTGRVADTTGGAVPGASVVLVNLGTGTRADTVTNAVGLFSFPSTDPGLYSITASLPGFATSKMDDVKVEVSQHLDLPIELKPGQLQETVVVAGGTTTPLLTTGAERSVVVEQTFVKSIPLNLRIPLLMVNSVVGVTPALATTGNNSASQSATNTFQINGTKATTSDQQIDGAANLVSYLNQSAGIPQVDAIEEFRVVTTAYAPENGRTSGGVVQFSLRSGTSRFRGSGTEFYRNSAFDANSFDANRAHQPKLDLGRNQFGFTMGGPLDVPGLKKGRTFFFAGYEGLRQNQAGLFTATVPTALERIGDFSQTRDAAGNLIVIYDPRTTRLDPAAPAGTIRYIRDPFPGNVIPSGMLSQVGLNILKLYPLPNQPGQGQSSVNNYFSNAATTLDADRVDVRVDHSLNDKNRLTFHFDDFHNHIGAPDYYGSPYSPNASPNMIPGISAMMRHTWVVNANLVWEHHLSYGLSQTNRTSPSYGFDPASLGFSQAALSGGIPVFPVVVASRLPAGTNALLPSLGNSNGWYERSQNVVWQYLGSASWLRGRHAVKAGVDFRKYPGFLWINEPMRINANNNFTGGPNPQAAAAASGSGAADLLLGAASISNGIQDREEFNHPYLGLYFQDEFRFTPKLTLTYGLRYNIEPSWSEAQNRLGFIDTTSRSPLADQVAAYPNLVGGVGFPEVGDNGSRPAITDRKAFDPRAALAWSVNDKTVAHGGFGVFHHPGAQYGFENATSGSKRVTNALVTQPNGVIPLFNLADPFPNGVLPITGTSQGLSTLLGQSIVGIERNQKASYQIAWSGDVQRELSKNFVVTAGYVGNVGRNLLTRVNLNQLADSNLALGSQLLQVVPNPFYGIITDSTSPLSQPTVTRGQLLRPFPQFLDVTQVQSALGHSRYNAMQLTVERRFSSGLGTVFSYTLSRTMDNVSDVTAAVNAQNTFQDLYCQSCDWSVSPQDITQVFRWTMRYDVPLGTGHKFLNRGMLAQVFGGWGVAGFAQWDTGTPLRLTSPNDSSSFGGGVQMRPNLTGQSPVIDDRQLTDGGFYFNPAAFSRTPPFTFGTALRTIGSIRNPGGRNLDLLIEKRVATGGSTSFSIRLEAFNALNYVQLGGPVTSVTSASFGRIFFTQLNAPRQLQVGGRFSF